MESMEEYIKMVCEKIRKTKIITGRMIFLMHFLN